MGYGVLGINGKTPQVIVMGVIQLNKMESHYLRLSRIFERVTGLVEQYLPDELAIETVLRKECAVDAETGQGAGSGHGGGSFSRHPDCGICAAVDQAVGYRRRVGLEGAGG